MSLSATFSSFTCGPWSQGGFGHGGFGHGGFGMGSGAWFGGFHFPFGLLTLALLGFAAFWLISRNRIPVRQESASPLEVLKRRYAAGEIDREEFLRQSADIKA